MKKVISLLFAAVAYIVFFCFQVSAENVPLKENSWRYKNGEPAREEYSISLIADPSHPDASYTGIDVSHHQGTIDWEKVKNSGVDFAIIRCGFAEDKTEYDDRCWQYNVSECERLDIPYGVYLYSYAESVEDALSEADHVLRLVEGHNLSLPVYYDLEENSMIESGLDLAAVAKAFCGKVSQAGYPVGVYANLNWWTYYLTDECFDNWHRWVARWNETCGYDGEYAVWQYTDMGFVEGIDTNVDMNFLIGAPEDHKIWTEKTETPSVKLSCDKERGKPKLVWNEIEGAQEYQIWRKTSKNGRYKLYCTTNDTSVTDSAATAGKKYYYRVKAISTDSNVGNSAYSAQKYVTCDLAVPVIETDTHTDKVKVEWNAVEGAAEYEVYRAATEDGQYTSVCSTENTYFEDSDVKRGETCWYKVKALHKTTAANSAFSVAVSRTRPISKPDITLSNAASSGKIRISWEAVKGAEKYEVYRSDTKDGEYSLIITTEKTSVINTKAAAGKKYYYKVRAIHANSAANSAYSAEVSRTCDLARPVVTLSNVASSGKIKISWEAVEGAEKYEVYRSATKDGEYSRIITTEKTSAINTKISAGKKYYYKVRAIHANSAANSAYSVAVSRTCDLARPVVMVSKSLTGKPKLSWSKIEGAAKYEIYRAESENGTYKRISTTSKTSMTNTKVSTGKTYYYKVRAVHENSTANSAYSKVVSFALN